MYFNTGSMAQLFVFYFGENRWRHPTDRRDMNRERNSSKSWGDGNLDSMSVYGHQLHRFIFSHQKPLKVSLWPVLQLFRLFCLKIFCSIYQKPNNKKILYWKVLIFDFIGGPLEPVLLQPARIYVNQFWENWFQSSCCPNWHTSFTTTLYLNTSEFRYLRWCTIKSHYFQEFHKTDWGQTWSTFLKNLNACESWKPQERHVHWTLVKQVASSQF